VAITHGLAALDAAADDPEEEELPDEQALAPSPTIAAAASIIANDRDRCTCRLMYASLGGPALVSTIVRYAHVTCII
jgi:hypothetical protein